MIYADTSVIVSLLINDFHSLRARALVETTNEPLVHNVWLGLEIENALGLTIFRQHLSHGQVLDALDLRDGWLNSGYLRTLPCDIPAALETARKLSGRYTFQFGCRSLDVVHVAMALESGMKVFWSFDERQRTLAATLGLTVNED